VTPLPNVLFGGWRGRSRVRSSALTGLLSAPGSRSVVITRARAGTIVAVENPEGDKRSVTELEADEVGASLKWATAKVERTTQRGNGDRSQGRERQAERGGDFNDAPPF
jgi:hypothetical protein